MEPLIIVKTPNGIALAKFDGELPAINLQNLLCFGELENSRSYYHDGVMAAIKAHFSAPIDAAEK